MHNNQKISCKMSTILHYPGWNNLILGTQKPKTDRDPARNTY